MKKALIMLLALASATPALAEEKLKILVLDLKTTSIDGDTAQLVADLMAVKLSQYPELEVFSGADVKRMMELEADKLATGCEGDSSCIADLAGALGARYVIYGRLGKLGTRFICTLNLFDAEEGRAKKRVDIKAGDLDKLGDDLDHKLDELVSPLAQREKVAVSTAPEVNEKAVSLGGEGAPVVREPAPPKKGDNTASLVLLGIGGGLFGLAYSCGACYSIGGFAGAIPAAELSIIPIAGPALSTPGAASGLEPVCLTCSGVQLVGAAVAGIGWLIAPGDTPPPKKVELDERSPTRLALVEPTMAY